MRTKSAVDATKWVEASGSFNSDPLHMANLTNRAQLASGRINDGGIGKTSTTWGSSIVVMYNDPILKEFSDYTINAKFKSTGDDDYWRQNIDIIARADLETATTNTNLFVSGTKQLAFRLPTVGSIIPYSLKTLGSNEQLTTVLGTKSTGKITTIHSLADSTLLTHNTTDVSYVLSAAKTRATFDDANNNKERTLKLMLDGSRIVYSLDGNEILDTNKSIKTLQIPSHNGANLGNPEYPEGTTTTKAVADFMSTQGFEKKKGAVGFSWNRSAFLLAEFAVSVNVTGEADMPKYTPIVTNFDYDVSYESPALPMYANKQISLKNIGVQFKQGGRFFKGEDLTWEIDASCTDKGSIVLNNTEKTVAVVNPGVYSLMVTTASGSTTRVHIIANEEGDTTFNLVDLDFTESGAYNPSDWISGVADGVHAGKTTNYTLAASPLVSLTKEGLNISKNWSAKKNTVLYKNAALADFTDYNVTAGYLVNESEGGTKGYVGLVTRAQYDTSSVFAAGSAALFLNRYNTGGVWVSGVNEDGNGNITTLHSVADANLLKYTTTDPSYVHFKSAEVAGNTNGTVARDVEVILKGGDVKYSYGGKVIFDSKAEAIKTLKLKDNSRDLVTFSAIDGRPANTEDWGKFTSAQLERAQVPANTVYYGVGKEVEGTTIQQYSYTKFEDLYEDGTFSGDFSAHAGKGTVGFTVGRSKLCVTKLSVTVDVDLSKVPAGTDFNYYIVKDNNFVFPMTAGYKVSTQAFIVQIGDGMYMANEFDYTSKDTSIITVDNAKGEINAVARGAAYVTLTHKTNPSITRDMFVVAKGEDEEEYYFYSKDFRDLNADVSDFQTVIVNENGAVVGEFTGNYAQQYNLPGFVPYDVNGVAEKVEAGYNKGTGTTYGRTSTAYTILNSDIVRNAVKNYKVVASIRQASGLYGGVGVAGRITGDNAGKYQVGTTGYGYAHLPKGSKLNYGNYSAGKKDWSTYEGLYILDFANGSFALNTKSAWDSVAAGSVTVNQEYPWTYNKYTNNYTLRDYTIEFNQNTVIMNNSGIQANTMAEYEVMNGTAGVVTRLDSWNYNGLAIYQGGYADDTEANWYKTQGNIWDAVPVIMEFKVALVGVENASKIPTEKIDAEADAILAPAKGAYKDSANYTFKFSNGVLGNYQAGDGYSQKVTVPEKIDNKAVTSVNYGIFIGGVYSSNEFTSGVLTVNELVFPKNISKLSAWAVKDTRLLERVTLPAELTKIEDNVFLNSGLTEVVIPSLTASIGRAAFSSNTSLVKVTLGTEFELIGSKYENVSELEYSKLVKLENEVFANCYVLEKAVLPISLKEIGKKVFENCSNLKEVRIYNTELTFADMNDDGKQTIPKAATIYGGTGSTAEAYAAKKGIKFVAIDAEIAAAKQYEIDRIAAENARKDAVANTEVTGSTYTIKDRNDSGQKVYDISGFVPGANATDVAGNVVAGKYVLPTTGKATVSGKETTVKITGTLKSAFGGSEYKSYIYGLVLPEGYATIGDDSFGGCSNLRYVDLPESIRDIGKNAFQGADLSSLTIPASAGTIGANAFANNSQLSTVIFETNDTFVSTVYSIGESAFANCDISEINIPVNVRTIGKNAFSGNAKLAKVIINNPNATIGENAFPKAAEIHVIAGSKAEQNIKALGYTNVIADVTDVWSTLDDKDLGNTYTYSVNLPTTAFTGFSGNGGKITVPQKIDFTAADGKVTENAAVNNISYNICKFNPDRLKLYAIELPEGIVTITDSAFIRGANLRYINIPNSVREIDSYAFAGTNLQGTIVLGVNVVKVGVSAFGGNITDVYIYNPDCEVEDGAFPAGTVIHCPEGSKVAKYKCIINKVETPVTFKWIEAGKPYTAEDFTDKQNYSFEVNDTVGAITNYAIKNDAQSYSQKVVFPAEIGGVAIKTVNAGLFYNRPYTTTVRAAIISEGIEEIGDMAFNGATGLNAVSLPKSLKSIGSNAFRNTSLMGDLVIPEGVEKIGANAFAGCISLKSITCSSPNATIGNGAFASLSRDIVIRGLDGSPLHEYCVKNKITWESLGKVDGYGEEEPSNPEQEGGTQNNAGDTNEGGGLLDVFKTMDLTTLIIIGIAALLLLILIIAVVIIIIVANSDDDDDDDDDDDEYEDDDEE